MYYFVCVCSEEWIHGSVLRCQWEWSRVDLRNFKLCCEGKSRSYTLFATAFHFATMKFDKLSRDHKSKSASAVLSGALIEKVHFKIVLALELAAVSCPLLTELSTCENGLNITASPSESNPVPVSRTSNKSRSSD